MERSVGISAEIICELKEVVKERKLDVWVDNLYERLWPCKFSGARDYSVTFGSLSMDSSGTVIRDPNALKNLIKQKREETGLPFVLDLMSYGGLIIDLSVQGCSVALKDTRPIHRRKLAELLGNGFIEGDIRKADTWRSIDTWLRDNGNGRKFDLITCRPSGGLDAIPQNETYYKYALCKLYSLLSKQDGYLLLEFNKEMFDFVKVGQKILQGIPGIEVRVNPKTFSESPTFLLVKRSNAPDELVLGN